LQITENLNLHQEQKGDIISSDKNLYSVNTFICCIYFIGPYMFRPILGHHQRNKSLYPHEVEMPYNISEMMHARIAGHKVTLG
jgi:hypothetical protein